MIDLSLNVTTGMQTCGVPWHTDVSIEAMGTIETVGRNTKRIVIGSHSGTHMDAPSHFYEAGKNMEALDIECMCGNVSIIDLSECAPGTVVTPDMLPEEKLTERVLLIYGWYVHWNTENYYKDFPVLSIEAAKKMLDAGVRFVAMDTPSPDSAQAISLNEDSPVHKLFLGKEMIIVEYLCNTKQIDINKQYEIFALPLKLVGSDGSPCRVFLREKGE